MSSQESVVQEEIARSDRLVRHPLLFLVGSALLGLAIVLLLFGSRWFGKSSDQVGGTPLEQRQDLTGDQASPSVFSLDSLVEVGDVAPDFTIEDLDGNPHRLSDLRGHPIVLNFWATWCAPCRVEMPELQAAYDAHLDDGLVMWALDYDEPVSAVRRFFYDEFELTFTPLIDEDGLVSSEFGVFGFPSTIFIDVDGVVKAIHRGPMTQAQVEEHLTKIIPGQT